jgi:ribosome maturation factor RimP
MIPQQEIVDKISHIALPIVQESALELVDVELVPSGRRWVLRIYIEREGGVTISDCERVSRELDRILDVEDVLDHPYVLEVSSPGLTRPLKKAEDFERYKGRKCKIITRSPVDGKIDFRGEIVNVAGDEVEVKVEGDVDVHRIPLHEIKKANLEFEL